MNKVSQRTNQDYNTLGAQGAAAEEEKKRAGFPGLGPGCLVGYGVLVGWVVVMEV